MESSEHNWANISETICPKVLIFGEQASCTLFFQNILTNPIISQISFSMTSHFGTLLTLCLYFQMLRAMSSLCVPNFDSAPSSVPRLQSIIHFPQLNPLVPGLKLQFKLMKVAVKRQSINCVKKSELSVFVSICPMYAAQLI